MLSLKDSLYPYRGCIFFIYFREKKGERDVDVREKHGLVAACTHPTGGPSRQPLGVRQGAPPAEPPGQSLGKVVREISLYS